MIELKNRYEIVALVEARMCNPNGDPDMGNRPRIDLQTGRGIITDVAFKARMRNYVIDACRGMAGMEVLMRSGASINMAIADAVLSVNGVTSLKKNENKKVLDSTKYMCERYWDVRTFGAVLSTGLNAGQVRGAVQVGMALSVDPIEPVTSSITRRCYTEGDFSTLAEYAKADAVKPDDKKRTMGDKSFVPYGLYVLHATVSANLAQKVGFTEEDFGLLLESIVQMYNDDTSSSKMGMSVLTPIVVFKHVGVNAQNPAQLEKEALLGCVPSYKLFDLVSVHKKDDVEFPRSYQDYDVKLQLSGIPAGVDCGIKKAPYSDIDWISGSQDVDLFAL